MERIVLASGSPRRRELLTGLGLEFEVKPSNVEERQLTGERPGDYVERLAREKANSVSQGLAEGIVIGADTVVVVDDQLLEKPTDAADARRMLRLLSGCWHEVLTGLCLVDIAGNRLFSAVESSRVLFQPLTPEEIDWYLTTGEPFDKAGAYAIQGHGSLLVDRIDGNYFNIVGLPLNLLYRLAKLLGKEVRDWR